MTNTELKAKIKNEGFAQWQIAAAVGVSEMAVQRWLRENGNTNNQPRIIAALEKLKAERAAAETEAV